MLLILFLLVQFPACHASGQSIERLPVGHSQEKSAEPTLLPEKGTLQREFALEPRNDLSIILCSDAPDTVTRSRILVSPNAERRAYIEVVAFHIQPTEEVGRGHECANRAKLLLAQPDAESFQLVYLSEPSPWRLGNGMKLIDWSPDGRYLLLEIWRWQHYSDVLSNSILIYDSIAQAFLELDHNAFFSKRFNAECFVMVSAMGFTSKGEAVFDARDDVMISDSCVGNTSTWLHSPYAERISLMTEKQKMQRHGKWEEHKPQE